MQSSVTPAKDDGLDGLVGPWIIIHSKVEMKFGIQRAATLNQRSVSDCINLLIKLKGFSV